MKRIIYCVFLQKYDIGLDSPCYPGELGEKIYKNISKKAWKTWIDQQTILINEQKLNLMNPTDRRIIQKEMETFLFKKITYQKNTS